MAKAGFCAQCDANVWLTPEGACMNGHGADQIRDVYEVPDHQPEGDAWQRAGDEIGKAVNEATAAAEDAWKKAQPKVEEAWGKAQPHIEEATRELDKAADKAADKAKEIGGKIWSWGKKQAERNNTGGFGD